MKRFRMTRRGFVRAAAMGAGALSLPLLGRNSSRAAGEFPQRFVVFFSANGTWPDEWRPDGGETDFTLKRVLAPLEEHRDKLLILDGLDQQSTSAGPGDGHQKGMGHILTGSELLPGGTVGGCDSCPGVSWASSISVDQRIANHIGTETRYRSLELGVNARNNANVWTRMCYRGASEPLPPENDPYAVFDRVFGELDTDRFGNERQDYMRREVVDFINQDFRAVRAGLGADDRLRMERHIEGIDEIARRLDNPTALGAACMAPDLGATVDYRQVDNFPAVGQLMMDQTAMALACDLTRVVSIQWSNAVSTQTFPWLGFSDRHHDLSHEGNSNTEAIDKIVRINEWYAQQFGYLMSRLAEIPEGDGSLLDNTCILWVNELGKGNSHTRNNMPLVMGGSAGGKFRTGRVLRFDDRPHNDLLTSLCQAYGIETESFGDERFNTGAISELV